MPTRVLLLRHAESANPLVFHGAESDVGLSPRGRRQAAALAPVLAAHGPAGLVSSAMCRAIGTALPAARACRLPLHLEPGLHERRVGSLSGTPTQAREGAWPDTLRRWMAGQTDFAPPGAESFDALRARVLPVWEQLTARFEGRTLVVVCHGIICRILLLSVVPGFSPADWHRVGATRNAALNEMVLEAGAWRLVRCDEVPEPVARA